MIKIRTLITKRSVEIALFALSVILSLSFSVQASAEPISIMAFNVENLFDARDDPGKSDETYLPANKKKAKAHITKCEQITVRRWREQCLY